MPNTPRHCVHQRQAICLAMAFSDAPSPRWDRIFGFVVWLGAGFVLLDPLVSALVANCASEECRPSFAWRLLLSVLSAFSLSAFAGSASSMIVKKVFYRQKI